MSSRPTKKGYYLAMLQLVASRSTCIRRAVGCIITDLEGHVLSTGYNGVPSGFDHCVDRPCLGASEAPGNTSHCMAIHAEQNALLQCSDLDRARIMYCSNIPCFVCAKMIANTNIEYIICEQDYADERGKAVLAEKGVMLEIGGVLLPHA